MNKKQPRDPEITAPVIPPTLQEKAARFRPGENVTYTPEIEKKNEIPKKHNWQIRKAIFVPVASVVAVATVVTAATGVAPIGETPLDVEPGISESLRYSFMDFPDEITMFVGEENWNLSMHMGELFAFSYYSADPSVASFDHEGVLFANSTGETLVEVACDMLMLSKTVRVRVVDAVIEAPRELNLFVGEDLPLHAHLITDSEKEPYDVVFGYVSSDPSVAEVDGEGFVYAKSPGETVVTVSVESGPFAAPAQILVKVSGDEPADGYRLSRTQITMYTYDSFFAASDLYLVDGSGESVNCTLQFESLTPDFVRVVTEENGMLFVASGDRPGDVRLRVFCSDPAFEGTVDVTVLEPDVTINEVYEMEVGDLFWINPQLHDLLEGYEQGDFAFSVSDPSVVTVSEEGLITAVGPGQADVTVTLYGPYWHTSFTVTVAEKNAPTTVTHTHDFSVRMFDNDNHWLKCALCDEISDVEAHDFSLTRADASRHWQQCSKCDATRYSEEHIFFETIVSDDGSMHGFRCLICRTQTEFEPHTPITVPGVAATCVAGGKTDGSKCSVCGTVLEAQRELPPAGHTEEIDAAVAATCTEPGYTEGSHCAVCGEVLREREMIPAAGHDFGDWYVVKAPSDTEVGEEARTCSVCGETITRQIDPEGHQYTAVVTPPTCTEQGYTTHTCNSCGDVYIDEYTAAIGHDFGSWRVTTEPACTEPGVETRACSRCTATETREVPAAGHKITADPPVAATCTTDGKTEGSHCSVCGEVFKEQTTIPATGHTPVVDPAVKATCTTSGKTEGSHCSVCGEVIQKQWNIPKKGHTVVTDPAVEATCTEAGMTEGSHCSVCNVILTEQKTVPAKGHTVVTDPAVAATCTAAGKTEGSHCSVCNVILTEQKTIGKLGHDYASTTAVCTRCGDRLATVRLTDANDGNAKTLTPDNASSPTAIVEGRSYNLSATFKSGVTYNQKTIWQTGGDAATGAAASVGIRSQNDRSCVIYAIMEGTGELILTFENGGTTYELSFFFEVGPAPQISIGVRELTLYTGDTEKVTATLSHSTGTIVYKSSDTSVFTVSSKGVLTAKSAGVATLTVTSSNAEDDVTGTVRITVKDPPWDSAAPRMSDSSPAGFCSNGEVSSVTYSFGRNSITYSYQSENNWSKNVYGSDDGVDFVYDPSTNTVTFSGLTEGTISATGMGAGFKIKLVGSNALDSIFINGAGVSTAVTFTGTGTLTVNESMNSYCGIDLSDHVANGDLHEACLIVEGGVRLTVYGGTTPAGTSGAIIVRNTSLEKGICTLGRIVLSSGSPAFIDEQGNYSIVDDSGAELGVVYFIPV